MTAVTASITSFGSRMKSISRSRSAPSVPTSKVDTYGSTTLNDIRSEDSKSALWSSPFTGYSQTPPPKYEYDVIQALPLVPVKGGQDVSKSKQGHVETHIEAVGAEGSSRSSDEDTVHWSNSTSPIRQSPLQERRMESQSDIRVQTNVHVTSSPQHSDHATAHVLDKYAVASREKTMRMHEKMKSGVLGLGGRRTPR